MISNIRTAKPVQRLEVEHKFRWLLAAFLLPCMACVAPAQALTATAPNWEAPLRSDLNRMAANLTATLKPWPVSARSFPVENYGAVADGQSVNTQAIQKAINACSAAGGGTVLLSRGDYVSGTIELKSGVMLQIDRIARLLASTNLQDYPDHVPARATIMDSHYNLKMSLIYAENQERVGICGDGEINGRGVPKNFPGGQSNGTLPGRPFLIRFVECKKVVMDGIRLLDSAAWMENYLNCDDVILQNLWVQNQANYNNDGIDLDGCHNVIVRGCFLNSEDDGLCFKGAGERTMENVLVENCRFYSTCNAVKFGTDSQGGFRNVLIRNIEVGGPSDDLPAETRRTAISGISWQSVDGGTVENIVCENVRIVRTRSPISLRLGTRGRMMPGQPKKVGAIRRIVFDGIRGESSGLFGSSIVGVPGAIIADVVVRNVSFSVEGGGEPQGPKAEKEGDYPEATMFGPTPAYGFWVSHASDVSLFNIAVTPQKPDARPFVKADEDVKNVLLDGKTLIPVAPVAAP